MAAAPRFGAIRSGVRIAVAVVLVIVLAPFALNLSHLLGALPNPFATEHHERVQPPVLKSLQDLSEYHASSANLSAVVEDSHDPSYIPSFLAGESTTFLAVGSVDAVVDFRTLSQSAIQTSPDGKSVTVTLPTPTYAPVHLDLENSQVLSHDRGLANRIGDVFTSPGDDKAVYQLGSQALQNAASQSGVLDKARANTTSMLTGMLHQLGFTNVTVTFAEPAPAAAPAP
ncbi:MAG TPA: DUF4230 domain-containing protein [Acidimicrobiales bacterium]|nr:DUF4230 domain-containing protein [Acidimicrobiales bacterium]